MYGLRMSQDKQRKTVGSMCLNEDGGSFGLVVSDVDICRLYKSKGSQ